MMAGSHGASIFSDSFDYGGTDSSINGLGGWTVGSSVLKYDADGGLTAPKVAGAGGGAMWLDFNDARIANNASPNFVYSTLGAGDELWLSFVVDFTTGGTTGVSLDLEGGVVSDILFDISTAGAVSVGATLNSNVNQIHSTGLNLTSGTHHVLLRAIKGTGASPIDSQLDLWLNPTNTSNTIALGTSNWTLDSGDGQIKWGRDTDTFSSIDAGPSSNGRIDEIRITTSFAELNLVPEPSSALMILLSGFFLLFVRRR